MSNKSNKPIPQHLNDFLDYLDIEKGLSNISQKNYHRFLNKFLHWSKLTNNQELKPHELNPQHIWDYKLYLSRFKNPKTQKYLKKTTQSYYLIALRSFLDYFSDKDIEAMSSSKVKLPKSGKERVPKFLNLDQIEKLLLQPNTGGDQIGLRDRAILEVLFSTGTRVAELVFLNRDQFNGLKNNPDELELTIIGKGEKPRTIYFSQRAILWLKKYLDTRKDDDNALFVRYAGPKKGVNRLSIRSIEKIVKKYAKLAGLSILTTPHTLRHSYATDLLTQGVDLRAVQEFLGHSNILTTQIYTHITNKRLRDIHKKFHSGNRLKD